MPTPQENLTLKVSPEKFFGLEETADYPAMAREAATRHRVDPNIFEPQIAQESMNYHPDVISGKRKSPKGAMGIAQFMKDTGARYGLTGNDFYDPYKSLDAAARHMRDLLDETGDDYESALAGYNAGIGRVHDKSWRNIPETRDYTRKILGRVAGGIKLKINPEEFFADPSKYSQPQQAAQPAQAGTPEGQRVQSLLSDLTGGTGTKHPEPHIAEQVDISAGGPMGEDETYRQWYGARQSGQLGTADLIAKNYLQQFPQGKYAKHLQRPLVRPISRDAAEKEGAGANIPVRDIEAMRQSGKTDAQVLREIQNEVGRQFGLSDSDLEVLTQKYGRHPLDRLLVDEGGEPASIDYILEQGKSNAGLSQFRIDPKIIGMLKQERTTIDPGAVQAEEAFKRMPGTGGSAEFLKLLASDSSVNKQTPELAMIASLLSTSPSALRLLDDVASGGLEHAAGVTQTITNVGELLRHPAERTNELFSDFLTGGHGAKTPIPRSQLADQLTEEAANLAQTKGDVRSSAGVRSGTKMLLDLLPIMLTAEATGGSSLALAGYGAAEGIDKGGKAAVTNAAMLALPFAVVARSPAGGMIREVITKGLAPNPELVEQALIAGTKQEAIDAATTFLKQRLMSEVAGLSAQGAANSAQFLATSAAVQGALEGRPMTAAELGRQALLLVALEAIPAITAAREGLGRAKEFRGLAEERAFGSSIPTEGRVVEPEQLTGVKPGEQDLMTRGGPQPPPSTVHTPLTQRADPEVVRSEVQNEIASRGGIVPSAAEPSGVSPAGMEPRVEAAATVPSSAQTIIAQIDALGKGDRRAVFLPEGQPLPAPWTKGAFEARGLAVTDVKGVGTFIHDSRDVSRKEVRQKAKDGSYTELLGVIEPPETTETTEAAAQVAGEGAQGLTKEPWQMTQSDYARENWQGVLQRFRDRPDILDTKNRAEEIAHFKQLHLNAVVEALNAGKPVPPEVLADYPDLAEKYAKPTAEPQGTTPAKLTPRQEQNQRYLSSTVTLDSRVHDPRWEQGRPISGIRSDYAREVDQPNLRTITPSDSVYHETSLLNAKSMIIRAEAGPRTHMPFFVSDNPDLALGQTGKGYLLEFDSSKINGVRSRAKPGLQMTEAEGQGGEFRVDKTVRGSLKSITAPNERGIEALRKIEGLEKVFDLDNPVKTERGLQVNRKGAITTKGEPSHAIQQIHEEGRRPDRSDQIEREREGVIGRGGEPPSLRESGEPTEEEAPKSEARAEAGPTRKDVAEFQRTTPAKGTPEREAIASEIEAIEKSAKRGIKLPPRGPKRDAYLRKEEARSAKDVTRVKELRALRSRALLEDTVETGEPENKTAALAQLQGKDAYEELKPLAKTRLISEGVSEEGASRESLAVASEVSQNPASETYSFSASIQRAVDRYHRTEGHGELDKLTNLTRSQRQGYARQLDQGVGPLSKIIADAKTEDAKTAKAERDQATQLEVEHKVRLARGKERATGRLTEDQHKAITEYQKLPEVIGKALDEIGDDGLLPDKSYITSSIRTKLADRGLVERGEVTEKGKRLLGARDLLRDGLPLSEYRAGTGHIPVPGSGWMAGEVKGAQWHTNGHFMLKGEPPKGPLAERSPDMTRLLPEPKVKMTAIHPIGFTQTGQSYPEIMWFSDGTAVNSAYVDYIGKRYKDAEYRSVKLGGEKPVYIYSKKELIGVLMPMRMKEHPPTIEALMESKTTEAVSKPVEMVRVADVDTPHQSTRLSAIKAKEVSWKKVKELRERIKNEPLGGNRQGLRVELMKWEGKHREAIANEAAAKSAIESRARELGQTTEPVPQNQPPEPVSEQPFDSREALEQLTEGSEELEPQEKDQRLQDLESEIQRQMAEGAKLARQCLETGERYTIRGE